MRGLVCLVVSPRIRVFLNGKRHRTWSLKQPEAGLLSPLNLSRNELEGWWSQGCDPSPPFFRNLRFALFLPRRTRTSKPHHMDHLDPLCTRLGTPASAPSQPCRSISFQRFLPYVNVLPIIRRQFSRKELGIMIIDRMSNALPFSLSRANSMSRILIAQDKLECFLGESDQYWYL
jgi:hypothetical protein